VDNFVPLLTYKGNIMQKTKLMVAVLGALCAMPVMAADAPASSFTPSSNVSLVSDYLYRGISQSGTNPAIQGGFDLAHASGAYVGVWGSSISTLGDAGIPNSGTEIDTYAGYKGAAGSISYDVGYLRYNYPGTYATGATKADTDEVYAAITYSIVTAKVSYSLGDTFGVAEAKGTTYMELNATYPIGETGYTLGAHYGMQAFKGTVADAAEAAGSDMSYADYKVSVSKDFSGYVVGLAYSSTDASPFYTNLQGKELGKKATVLSLSRSF
jgi:uncharacterized protein (TIGR02001 family)